MDRSERCPACGAPRDRPAAVTPGWSAATVPPALVAILDQRAGRAHSTDGSVRRTLAEILNAYDALRLQADRPATRQEAGPGTKVDS